MKEKNKWILLFIFIAISGSGLKGQASLDSLLYLVETGNPSLSNARQLLEARKLEAGTGLTPPNPEVEFGYLWGSPESLGNRTDFAVTQSFDFPTTYSSMSKLAAISKSQADLQYQATRQEIMLSARIAWIERIYLNKVNELMERRLETARKVLDGFERKFEVGEANRLELNQARMKVTALATEISLLRGDFAQNDAALMNLTGNVPIQLQDTVLPLPEELVLDTLLADYEQGYMHRAYQAEIDRRSKEVDVAFNKKLPRFKAGYYSEYILDTKLRGIQAGISIPLWEDARAVKSARARAVYAVSDAEIFWQRKQNEVRQLFDQWSFLKERISELMGLLAELNDEALLRQAVEAGEITLTDYYYESDLYFHNIVALMDLHKEMLILQAELRKVYY